MMHNAKVTQKGRSREWTPHQLSQSLSDFTFFRLFSPFYGKKDAKAAATVFLTRNTQHATHLPIMSTENTPPTESTARQGKVARLPHAIREELNRRIQGKSRLPETFLT